MGASRRPPAACTKGRSRSHRWRLRCGVEPADKINDPDLIYPQQQLNVPMNPTKAEVASAIEYAKTRGPWKNGQALSKDHAWLASQQGSTNGAAGSGSGG